MSGAGATAALPGTGLSIAPRDLQRLLIGLGLATSMQFYTFDSVNLVLPDMAGAFGVSRDEAGWILITYSGALFLGTPLSSYFARRIGLLPYLVGSILVFLGASIGCSMSTRLDEMLIFRSIEGFAGGALNFWWRGSVYLILTGPARSASMMRISVMLYAATVVGLLCSGFLVDHLSWRFMWVIDAVLAAGALFMLLRYYPRQVIEPDRHSAPIDPWSALLFGVGVVALQIVLSRGEINDWFGSPMIVALTWVAVIAIVLFVFRCLDPSNANPLLRLWMVKDRNVLAAIFIGLLTGMILSGSLYALPEYLRGVATPVRSASQTGQILCVYALTAMCIRPVVVPAIGRFGQRRVTIFALACMVASMLVMTFLLAPDTPTLYYALPLVLYAGCLAPLLSAVGSGTAARVAGPAQMDAVSIYMTFRQLGAAMGVAFVNIVLDRREAFHSSRLFEHLRTGAPTLGAWTGAVSRTLSEHGGRSTVDATATTLRVLKEAGAQQASTLAFADAFRTMALIGVAALALTPLMPPPARKKG